MTLGQVHSLAAYADRKRDAGYSLDNFNCTTFAVGAVRATGHDAPSGKDLQGRTYPNALYKELYKALSQNKPQDKEYDTTKWRILVSLSKIFLIRPI